MMCSSHLLIELIMIRAPLGTEDRSQEKKGFELRPSIMVCVCPFAGHHGRRGGIRIEECR